MTFTKIGYASLITCVSGHKCPFAFDDSRFVLFCFFLPFIDGTLLAGVCSLTTKNSRMGCLQGNERCHKTLFRCVSNSTQAQLQSKEGSLWIIIVV